MSDRKQPIFDTEFWRKRILEAPAKRPHEALFFINLPNWKDIEEQHKRLLQYYIQRHHSVLDVGCGWGRLLTLMPISWFGPYLGIDLSPDFIALAKERHPERINQFVVADARDDLKWTVPVLRSDDRGGWKLLPPGGKRDWAVLVSIKGMVIKNAGQEVWEKVESRIKEVVEQILILEYRIDDKGEVL